MEKSEFNLYVCNFLPETLFWEQYGKKEFFIIKHNTINKGRCMGCGHEPRDASPEDVLSTHIYSINKENVIESKAVTLCKGCHATQHIVMAIEQGWVRFVNSSFSQEYLVKLSRMGNLRDSYKNGKIVDLKKTPEEILEEIRSGVFKQSATLKVLFTDNFVFNDF